MEAKAKLFGHPIHQMLIVLPLGLLIGAWLADVAFFIMRRGVLAEVAYWNTIGGVASGLFVAIFGFIDWLAIPIGSRAKRVGAWHAGLNVLMLLLFTAGLVIRHPAAGHAPNTLAFICATAGLGTATVAGWFGGELIDRLGIGVSTGANVDAPSSLSGKAARADTPSSR